MRNETQPKTRVSCFSKKELEDRPQPSTKTKDVAVYLKLPQIPYIVYMYINSEYTGETERMRKLS